jgi:hypothetical protein
LILLSSIAIMLCSYSVLYPSGAPAAKTGLPGDGASCTQCHGGTATITAGLITSNIPAGGYIPGQTYQITASNTLTGSGKYGFEVSPQNSAGIQLGTLVAGTGSKLVSGSKYITQSTSSSSTNTWTFGWVAPMAGTGAVTFYGAFARNYTGATTLSTLAVQELTTTGIPDNATGIRVLTTPGGNLNLEMNTDVSQSKVIILDLNGRVILNTSIPGKGSHQLVQNLHTGVYLVVV